MDINLRADQKAALEKIVSVYNEGVDNVATVCMATGSGGTTVLCECINRILKDNANAKVLYLVQFREEAIQFGKLINVNEYNVSVCTSVKDYVHQSVLVLTYQAFFANAEKMSKFKSHLIICRGAEALNSEKYNQLLNEKCRLLLGVLAVNQINEKNLFYNAPCLYVMPHNYDSCYEYRFLEQFAVPMLRHMGYKEIQTVQNLVVGNKAVKPDIVALKDGITYFIEIKTYRGMFNDRQVIRQAIAQIIYYKYILHFEYPNSLFGLILLCDVEKNVKSELAEEYGIFVWDIKNLLHICSDSVMLSNMLERVIPYSLNGIKPEKPIDVNFSVKPKAPIVTENKYETELIDRLKNCNPGRTKKADKEYEKICAEIIDYLFKNEFSQFYEQHSTKDDMFRMDIICGLKGTVAFWKFLIMYYNTKFVVFECKNYSHKIEQNLIYVTDKYLFNPILRNVAFIISRKGFSDNAQKAALGILKEQGKLILDLTDSDLEIMIKAKSEGKEPSDFLLDKVEKLLMSVSI